MDKQRIAPEESARPAPIKKKPYSKPELVVYGDLTQITHSVHGSNANDGAGHPNRHFTS